MVQASKKNANQISKLKSEIGIIVWSIKRETIDKRKIKGKTKAKRKDPNKYDERALNKNRKT